MTTEPEVKPKPQKSSRLTPCGEETIMDLIMKFLCDEAGAPALEYALILALLGIGLISAINAIGGALTGAFTLVAGKF